MKKNIPNFSIILAAGKGTRMKSASVHKVCFPVDGEPIINRSISMYKEKGIKNNIVIVGAMAGQVIETIGSKFDDVIYAYQKDQRGTAHAAHQGAKILEDLNDDDDVLIVAGDRLIEPIVLDRMFDDYYSNKNDLTFLVAGRESNGTSSVLLDEYGDVIANYEMADIHQRSIYKIIDKKLKSITEISKQEVINIITDKFNENKAINAFDKLWEAVCDGKGKISSKELLKLIPEEKKSFSYKNREGDTVFKTPQEIEKCELTNCSVYLIKVSALLYAFSQLKTDNAQKEKYLSDVITIMAQGRKFNKPAYKVHAMRVDEPNYLMAFNDPSELLQIEEYLSHKKVKMMENILPNSQHYRTVKEWKDDFSVILSGKATKKMPLYSEILDLYTKDDDFINKICQNYINTLDFVSLKIDENEKVMLVRSPGRVNLLGRHVDHQGGHCNLMTIGFETIMVIRPRRDDMVNLFNIDNKNFPDRNFSIGDMIKDLPWDDWLSLVNSSKVSSMILEYGGDWSQYAKAAVLRLQKRYPEHKLNGADLFLNGNIPPASGLSSSSAFVVAVAEAMIGVNQLEIYPSQLVDLCGEGEWFVGTRGGSADHAAIKFGKKDKVVKVKFHPFVIEDIVPFPDDYILAVCNSGIEAQKSSGAKDQFNHRVACYQIGLMLIRKVFPRYSHIINYLRDINKRNLDTPLAQIYKMLLRLPEHLTRDEIKEMFSDEDLDIIFSTHKRPTNDLYPIRDVVLYGVSECERSFLFADALKNKNMKLIGKLMNISHNGDRVVLHDDELKSEIYSSKATNEYLLDLIDDLESGDPDRVERAQVQWQPGSYGCSVAEIDRMVDVSLKTDGVVGAQLAGAGLGGCMMVLAKRESMPKLINNLNEKYYIPFKKTSSILSCTPVDGSKILLKN